MARIKFDTARAFANHKRHRDASAFYSTGDAIFSYAMRLAHWESVYAVQHWDGLGWVTDPIANERLTRSRDGAEIAMRDLRKLHPDLEYRVLPISERIVYDYDSRQSPYDGKRAYSATTNAHMIALEAIVPRETPAVTAP